MPGIVGCITRLPADRARPKLLQMLSALSQQEFYVNGTWSDEALGVYVGWTARQGSFCDPMPVSNEQGDIVLAFSGEEMQEADLVRGLKDRGHIFPGNGPSYLAHLAEEDAAFPAGLNGRFHGLLADRRRNRATLFNDRFGMHRLYFHESADSFYFAVEAKAILAVCPELRRLNAQSLGEFVSSGAVLENRSLFEGIQVLPPGSAWIFENGRLQQKASYFEPAEWENQEALEKEAYYRELRETFTHAVSAYFSGRERIGMSLTGGLDTRMVLAGQRPEPGSLPCYTFGSMFRENYDVRVARQVAEVCGQPHQVITAGRGFLSRFPEYANRAVYVSDGCADVGRAPDLYLNEQARAVAPVRMTGNYGGEILRGIVAFRPTELAGELFAPEFLLSMREGAETYRRNLSGNPVSFAVFKQGPWYLHSVLTLEQTQISMRSPFLDNDFVRTVFRGPAAARASNAVSVRLIADSNPGLLDIPTDRGVALRGGGLRQKSARGALEFLFKAEYASDMGMPQWLARIDALSPLRFERLFLGRHKPFHFRVWYRDALADYVREMLLDARSLSRPYINRNGLEAAVQGHLRGDRNYTNEIHKILTLELLHRIFLDGAS